MAKVTDYVQGVVNGAVNAVGVWARRAATTNDDVQGVLIVDMDGSDNVTYSPLAKDATLLGGAQKTKISDGVNAARAVSPLGADTTVVTGTITTASGANLSTAASTSYVAAQAAAGAGALNALVQVQGTAWANLTLAFEVSLDGTNWSGGQAAQWSNRQSATSPNLGASGGLFLYTVPLSGFPYFRLRNQNGGVMTGTANVTLSFVAAPVETLPVMPMNAVIVTGSDPSSAAQALPVRLLATSPTNNQSYVDAPVVTYPVGAVQGGSTTTTASSGANTYTWSPAAPLSKTRTVWVQNNEAAGIYVAMGTGTSRAATQGDTFLVGGQNAILSLDIGITWISFYTPSAMAVNGTAAGGIVVWAGV